MINDVNIQMGFCFFVFEKRHQFFDGLQGQKIKIEIEFQSFRVDALEQCFKIGFLIRNGENQAFYTFFHDFQGFCIGFLGITDIDGLPYRPIVVFR